LVLVDVVYDSAVGGRVVRHGEADRTLRALAGGPVRGEGDGTGAAADGDDRERTVFLTDGVPVHMLHVGLHDLVALGEARLRQLAAVGVDLVVVFPLDGEAHESQPDVHLVDRRRHEGTEAVRSGDRVKCRTRMRHAAVVRDLEPGQLAGLGACSCARSERSTRLCVLLFLLYDGLAHFRLCGGGKML
jgi:hypothetical protein